MNISQVKADITSNKLKPFYIFTGEETAVLNIYIQQIAKVSDAKIVRVDSFGEVYAKLSRPSKMFGSSKIVYVVREDKAVLSEEKIYFILDTAMWKDIVIFTFISVDKRTKFYKRYKDIICEFEPLETEILKKYVKKEINLSDKNCIKLIEVCENSYSRILLEIDKIKSFTEAHKDIDVDKAFSVLLEMSVIYIPPADAIFTWVEQVMLRKNVAKAFKYMQECFDSGNIPLMMLSALYNNVKQTLQVQSCKSNNVSKVTGLTAWQIKCVDPFINRYSNGELVKLMKMIHKCEKGIKTGQIESDVVIPYIMVNVL